MTHPLQLFLCLGGKSHFFTHCVFTCNSDRHLSDFNVGLLESARTHESESRTGDLYVGR
jgi:Zn-dependent M32 family carboxypeptidase